MASGVAVNSKVMSTFKDLVKDRKHRCAVFKINDAMTEIAVEKTFDPSADGSDPIKEWNSFKKTLPDSDCRYVAYDFLYEHQGAMKNRVLFALWSPPTAKIKSKMIYASSQEGVVNKLEGVQRQMQCMDDDDIKYESIAKLLKQHTAGY